MNSKKVRYIMIGVLAFIFALLMFFAFNKGNKGQETSPQKENSEQDIVINKEDKQDKGEEADENNLVVGEDDVQDNNMIEFEELEKADTTNEKKDQDRDTAGKDENSNVGNGESGSNSDEDEKEDASTDKLTPVTDTNDEYGPIT